MWYVIHLLFCEEKNSTRRFSCFLLFDKFQFSFKLSSVDHVYHVHRSAWSESTVCSSIRQSIPTAFAVTVQYLQLFNQWLGLELVFYAVKCWLPVIQLYVN